MKEKVDNGKDNLLNNRMLFELQYSGSFPAENFYMLKFNSIPNFFKFDKKFNDDVVSLFDEKEYTKIHESRRMDEKGKEYVDGIIFESSDSFFILDREYYEDDDKYLLSVNVLYSDFSKVEHKINEIKKHIEKPALESKIHLIVKASYGFSLSNFNVKKVKLDIGLNYGSEFEKKHKLIMKALNDEDKTGLIMLHGLPGAGKSTYVKYLTSKIKKKFIFFPSNMAEDLTSPSFVEFMIGQKDSVLVIEDAEKLIRPRENYSSNGISNLLNVTDGILGDILKIKIIATHNTKREQIDDALLRKGRLIVEHEFGNLSKENVEILLKKLKIDYNQEDIKPMILSDVYNLKEEKFFPRKPSKIGFN